MVAATAWRLVVFEADDAGNGNVISDEPTGGAAPQGRIGVQNCPERAISIED